MKPLLSLVTGTRNRQQSFDRLLNSIASRTQAHWELIVSDASDADAPLRCVHPFVNVLPERPRLGCTKGYNRAFAAAQGDFVIWLNDDAEVLDGYDVAAIQFMREHPSIGLGCLPYREMFYKNAARPFAINSYFGMIYANFGILRREFGDAIGWFDEDLPMYGNDNSIAFRTLLADKGIAAVPHESIIHHCEQDQERVVNDVYAIRVEAVNTLLRKYGPHMMPMRATYERHGGTTVAKDQTPQWALNQLAQIAL
jgi:GT2 family glycosyltransferase